MEKVKGKNPTDSFITCEFRPEKINMIKKKAEHSCGRGMMATGWGYIINGRLGPETNVWYLHFDIFFWYMVIVVLEIV